MENYDKRQDSDGNEMKLIDNLEFLIGKFGQQQFMITILLSLLFAQGGLIQYNFNFFTIDPPVKCEVSNKFYISCSMHKYCKMHNIKTKLDYENKLFIKNIITKQKLECKSNKKSIIGLEGSIFMTGAFIGTSIMGTFSESIGNRRLIIGSLITTIIGVILLIFSTNIYQFTIALLIQSISSTIISNSSYFLLYETIHSNQITQSSSILFSIDACSYVIGSMIFSMYHDIKQLLYFSLIFNSILLIFVQSLLNESPIQLIKTNKYDEFEKSIKCITKFNRNIMDEDIIHKFSETSIQNQTTKIEEIQITWQSIIKDFNLVNQIFQCSIVYLGPNILFIFMNFYEKYLNVDIQVVNYIYGQVAIFGSNIPFILEFCFGIHIKTKSALQFSIQMTILGAIIYHFNFNNVIVIQISIFIMFTGINQAGVYNLLVVQEQFDRQTKTKVLIIANIMNSIASILTPIIAESSMKPEFTIFSLSVLILISIQQLKFKTHIKEVKLE